MKAFNARRGAWASVVFALVILTGSTTGRGEGVVTSQLASPTALAGSTVDLSIFVQDIANVRGYQTRISIVQTSGFGTVSVNCPLGTPDPNVRVDVSRPDYIFFGVPNVFSSTNCLSRSVAVIRLSGGTNVGAVPAYLSTYTLTISPDAAPGSTFEIKVDPVPDSNFTDSSNQPIPYSIGPPSVLTIERPEVLEFETSFCSSCLTTGTEATVELRVSGLQEAINGVQALFSFDPGVLELVGVTMGDGAGSPWDSATPVFLTSNAGQGTLAVLLPGGSTDEDAVVATFRFNTVGLGLSGLDFRTSPPPFATKLTTASANETILPTTSSSGTIIVGQASKGDINGDGSRDGADIQRFSELLLDPEGASAEEFCAADLDGDGELTVDDDLDLFVQCLLTGTCVCQ